MESLIGVYKELRIDEELSFQSKMVTPAIFVKEAKVSTLFIPGKREVPIALVYANVYLTNQRLIFLVLYQMQAAELGKRRRRVIRSGIAGTWFEIPLSTITHVECARSNS